VRLLVVVLAVVLGACAKPAPPPTTPTPAPIAPTIRELPGRAIALDGRGSGESDPLVPQYGGGLPLGIDVLTLTHDGQSTFIVTAVQGGQTENVTSAIGAYTGQRPLVVQGPVAFQVTADGAWSITIRGLSTGGSPTFSGAGDAVSSQFAPPAPGNWSLSHDGRSTFFVYAHCLGGSIVVEDSSGAVQDAPTVQFPRGPCFWEVRADGNWAIKPAS